jgi:hypothetical protein
MPHYLLSVFLDLAVLDRMSSGFGRGAEIRIVEYMSVYSLQERLVDTVRHPSSHNAAATTAQILPGILLSSLQVQLEVTVCTFIPNSLNRTLRAPTHGLPNEWKHKQCIRHTAIVSCSHEIWPLFW